MSALGFVTEVSGPLAALGCVRCLGGPLVVPVGILLLPVPLTGVKKEFLTLRDPLSPSLPSGLLFLCGTEDYTFVLQFSNGSTPGCTVSLVVVDSVEDLRKGEF